MLSSNFRSNLHTDPGKAGNRHFAGNSFPEGIFQPQIFRQLFKRIYHTYNFENFPKIDPPQPLLPSLPDSSNYRYLRVSDSVKRKRRKYDREAPNVINKITNDRHRGDFRQPDAPSTKSLIANFRALKIENFRKNFSLEAAAFVSEKRERARQGLNIGAEMPGFAQQSSTTFFEITCTRVGFEFRGGAGACASEKAYKFLKTIRQPISAPLKITKKKKG